MGNWTDKYIGLLSSTHKQHILLEDRDNLHQYEELKSQITEAGYELLEAKSDFDVRLLYELKVKESRHRVIVVVPPGYKPLPDMAKQVHFQSIGLAHLFPNLDAPSIKGLSYNALCLLSNISRPYEQLGQERTLKFLLENLYHVDFDTLTQNNPKERVLNALVTVLLEKDGINQSLLQFLSRISKAYLPELVARGLNKQCLIDYLQQQWEAYLAEKLVSIDFEVPLLGKSIGYLFVFEVLKPLQVSVERMDTVPKALRVGAYVNQQQSNDNQLEASIQHLEEQRDSIEDLYNQWFSLIQVLANVKIKALQTTNTVLKSRFEAVEAALNQRFQRFLDNNYYSLFSLSGTREPIVVSRVLEYIKSHSARRKALLVIDGMAYWQWELLAKAVNERGLTISPGATMAYIPTITAWSRQAIFKGSKPDLSADNSKEKLLFEEYWKKNDNQPYTIRFEKLGVHKSFDVNLIGQDVTVLGLVCNDLDDIMHGSILGDQQLKASTEEWIRQSKIVDQLFALHNVGFTLYITSDHGNIEAKGIKNLRLKDKIGSLSRSKRHLHFSNETMLENFKEQNPDLQYGERNRSIYLKDYSAFTDENKVVITHGGSHLWEVLVPFITIK